MDVKEKLDKEEKKLQVLKKQKNTIDEKIKKLESNIFSLNSIINQKKFNEMSEVLNSNGLSLEEILKAVQSGDLLSLQERMEEKKKVSEKDNIANVD